MKKALNAVNLVTLTFLKLTLVDITMITESDLNYMKHHYTQQRNIYLLESDT